MLAEPTAAQLAEAVAAYLEKDALPALTGRPAFHGRVAVNVLRIIEREFRLGPAAAEREREGLRGLLSKDAGLDQLRAHLSDAIRAGAMHVQTPGLLEHLARTICDRVEIEQPNYASLKLTRGPASPAPLRGGG
jgi:hypothetical protein